MKREREFRDKGQAVDHARKQRKKGSEVHLKRRGLLRKKYTVIEIITTS
ncbi:MAG: hypothetical protein JRN23_06680 [Nitrososphaerota archaeon]|nr:hypothetical protein [Nitrososphaerota archaeon]